MGDVAGFDPGFDRAAPTCRSQRQWQGFEIVEVHPFGCAGAHVARTGGDETAAAQVGAVEKHLAGYVLGQDHVPAIDFGVFVKRAHAGGLIGVATCQDEGGLYGLVAADTKSRNRRAHS